MSAQTSFQLCDILIICIFHVICVKPTELHKYQISVILSAIMSGDAKRGYATPHCCSELIISDDGTVQCEILELK